MAAHLHLDLHQRRTEAVAPNRHLDPFTVTPPADKPAAYLLDSIRTMAAGTPAPPHLQLHRRQTAAHWPAFRHNCKITAYYSYSAATARFDRYSSFAIDRLGPSFWRNYNKLIFIKCVSNYF